MIDRAISSPVGPHREDSVTIKRSPFPDDESTTELPVARARSCADLVETGREHRRYSRSERDAVAFAIGFGCAAVLAVIVVACCGMIPR